MGGRLARGSSLSDPKVIAEINANFIAIDDNITCLGWPDMPALKPWKNWFDRHSDLDGVHRAGFTTSVVVTPDGKMALGTSGSGYVSEMETSVCYRPDKYLDFLKTTAQRYQRLRQIDQSSDKTAELRALQFEILKELHDRNRGGEG